MGRVALGAIASIMLASSAWAQSAPVNVWDSAKGPVFIDPKGMTLYTFDKDSPGKSTCNGPCTNLWPPLMATADAKGSGNWSVITRDDGGKQWAYKDKPIYAHSKDTKPGDTVGEGFKDVWHVAAR